MRMGVCLRDGVGIVVDVAVAVVHVLFFLRGRRERSVLERTPLEDNTCDVNQSTAIWRAGDVNLTAGEG
jgi:hypothetical protein